MAQFSSQIDTGERRHGKSLIAYAYATGAAFEPKG